MSSERAMNPSGGATVWRVMETSPLNPAHIVGWDSMSGYGPMTSTNRHVRDRREYPCGAPVGSALGVDPHAWWCGKGWLKAVPYPIISLFRSQSLHHDNHCTYL